MFHTLQPNRALPLKVPEAEVHPIHIQSSYLPCPVLQSQPGLRQMVSPTVISHCCPFQRMRMAVTVWLSLELPPPGSRGQVLCSAQGSVLLLGPAHKPRLQKSSEKQALKRVPLYSCILLPFVTRASHTVPPTDHLSVSHLILRMAASTYGVSCTWHNACLTLWPPPKTLGFFWEDTACMV